MVRVELRGPCPARPATMVAARSSGRRSRRDPLAARPMGERAVATMTASRDDSIGMANVNPPVTWPEAAGCGKCHLSVDGLAPGRWPPPRRRAGQQRVRPHPVAVGRRVEAVVAERARRRPGTPARSRRPGRPPTPPALGHGARPAPGPSAGPYQPTSWRSGGAIARTAPRSGQVPTTTSTPRLAQPAHRRAEVRPPPRRAGAGAVASFAPTRITATSGRSPSSARATWVARSVERDPDTPTLDSCDPAAGRRPRRAAAASWPPTVSSTRSTPTPSADESPSSTSRSGGAPAAADRGAQGQAQVGLGVAPVPGGDRLAGEHARRRPTVPASSDDRGRPAEPARPGRSCRAPCGASRSCPLRSPLPLGARSSAARRRCCGTAPTLAERRCRRSCAHRPAGPRSRPGDLGAADLGAGVPGRLLRGLRQRPHALARAVGVAPSFRVAPSAASTVGSSAGGGHRVPLGGRVEPVPAEHPVRLGGERAGRAGRRGRPSGRPPRPPRPSARRRAGGSSAGPASAAAAGSAGSCPGRGRCRRPPRQPAARSGAPPRPGSAPPRPRGVRLVTSLPPIRITAMSGSALQRGLHLVAAARPRWRRPRRSGAAAPAGAAAGTGRWRAARRASPAAVHAVAGGRRVAEDHHA